MTRRTFKYSILEIKSKGILNLCRPCRVYLKEENYMELKFEWDEEKERINRQKHGISFETASYVFRDEHYIEMYDFEHSMEEDRYIAIGMVGDLLFVVFTERGENIRLISARLATESERRLYYDQNFYN